MVRFTLKRNLRDASCCSVEVMNGGTGLRRFSRFATELTLNSESSTCATRFLADVSSATEMASSLRFMKRAPRMGGFLAFRFASIVQYSRLMKALISRSRSTMSRSATVCTRPADSPRRTLSHSSGEIL